MLPLYPLVQFSHWSWPPQIQVLLWYGMNGARVFVQLRPRHTERQSYKMSSCKNRLSFTLPWRQINVYLFLMTRVQSSHNHPVSPSSSPVSWVLPCLGSQDRGTQPVALTAHSPGQVSAHVIILFLWVSSQRHMSGPNHFSSFSTWWCVYHSYSLAYTRVFPPVSN